MLLSALCALRWRKQPGPSRNSIAVRPEIAIWSGVICGASLLYLVVSLFSSSATSTDYLLFWGVKAVRFADVRGISADFLRDPFTIHASLDYPPLVPVVQAWGCLAAGRMPWRVVPTLSALWVVAAVVLLYDRARSRLGDPGAAALVTFWTAAMSVSLVHSLSGGNAEAPVVCFEAIALAWLLTEQDEGESRFVPTLALCGAALTKVEGMGAVVLIAAGCYFRDRGLPPLRRAARNLALIAWPAAAVGVWFAYQWSESLRVGYQPHGQFLSLHPEQLSTIVISLVQSLDAGSLWLPWAFALGVLISRAPAWRAAAPALVLTAGLLLFLVFDYLHDKDDPTERIGWTAPRVTQPALSAIILGAGVLSLHGRRPSQPGRVS